MMKILSNKKIRIVLLFLIFSIIWEVSFELFKVDGYSMASSYVEGETVLVDKGYYWFNKPQRGDVVVFWDHEDNDFLIKRIIGIPEDSIEVIDGVIFVNDLPLYDEFSDMLLPNEGNYDDFDIYLNMGKVVINEGEYWLIGDNRSATWMGKIKEEDIIGILKE